MAREYFKCFHSYKEKTKSLTDAEMGRLFRALMAFSETGEAPSLAGRESIAFDFIADEIARDAAKYAETCKTNAINGAKGGKRTVADGTERKREEAKQSETDKVEGIKDIKENPPKGGKKKSTRTFIPPTVEEVKAYCEQRKNNIDAEYFVAYYSSQNWIKANGEPVHDWKQTVITWEKKPLMFRSVARDEPKRKNPALRYEQKPISKTDFDALTVNLGGELGAES